MTEQEAPWDFSQPIIRAAAQVASEVNARALFLYVHAAGPLGALPTIAKPPTELVLVARDRPEFEAVHPLKARCILVPDFDLTRMGQVKMATLLAFTQGILNTGDAFVSVTGVVGRGLDTIVAMQVGGEFELFQSVGQPRLTEHIRRAAFERVLRIALELAHEGREGKPVGGLFVIGDYPRVRKYCQESRINPFRGYPERDRNIIDESIHETIKELAKLDGAFILKGNGVIMSAGTILRPPKEAHEGAIGLGARHAAAAGITAGTRAIAVTLSESTGTVRLWRRGAMVMEFDRLASGPNHRGTAPPALQD